jgi:hypothetical protein
MYVCIYIHIYIHIYRERERERALITEAARFGAGAAGGALIEPSYVYLQRERERDRKRNCKRGIQR